MGSERATFINDLSQGLCTVPVALKVDRAIINEPVRNFNGVDFAFRHVLSVDFILYDSRVIIRKLLHFCSVSKYIVHTVSFS